MIKTYIGLALPQLLPTSYVMKIVNCKAGKYRQTTQLQID